MKLTIPAGYKDGFAALVKLSRTDLKKIRESVLALGPQYSRVRLNRTVAENAGIDSDQIAKALQAVGSLNEMLEDSGLTPQEVIEDLKTALSNDKDARLHPRAQAWAPIEEFLNAMVGIDGPLAITSKAVVLKFDHDRTYCSGKIVTDLRPIFKTASEKPSAAMVVHHLRISYHRNGPQTEELSVAMGREQLLQLRRLLERALKKEDQLRKLTEASNVTFLESVEPDASN